MWESLSQNQTTVDGNKRTTLAEIYVFSAINGVSITASDENTQVFVFVPNDTSSVTLDNLRDWLVKIPRLSNSSCEEILNGHN